MQVLSVEEVNEVDGGVTASQVLNYGAAVTAVGGAVLVGVATVFSAPALMAGGVAYGIVSGGMWLGSAMYDMGMFS